MQYEFLFNLRVVYFFLKALLIKTIQIFLFLLVKNNIVIRKYCVQKLRQKHRIILFDSFALKHSLTHVRLK